MTHRLLIAAGLAITLAISTTACADGEAAEQISNAVDVVDEATPGTDAGVLDQSKSIVCDIDRKTMLTAIDTFVAMEGRTPTEAELVGTYLREASPGFDIAADGTLIATPGFGCS